MARKELSASGKVVGVGVIALFIYFIVQIVMNGPNGTSSPRAPRATRQPSSLTVSRTNTPLPVVGTASPNNTLAPSPTIDTLMLTREGIEFYGVTFEAPFESVIAQGDFDLHDCPQFGCDVVATMEMGQRITIAGGVVGESKEGFEGWVIINSDDIPRYAHLYEVLPMDATAQANRTPSPTPGGRFELTPTLLPILADTPLCSEPTSDCDVLADLSAGDTVVVFAFVDGDGGVWAQVNFNNVIGYVVLDALDQTKAGGE